MALDTFPPGALIVYWSDGNDYRFGIAIERKIVLNDLPTLAEATMLCFAYHYVLNLEYSAVFTYDFLQRYVTRIGLTDRKTRPRVSNLALALKI